MTTSDKELIYDTHFVGSANPYPKSAKRGTRGQFSPRTYPKPYDANPEHHEEGERDAQSDGCRYQIRAVPKLQIKSIATNSPFGCASFGLLYRNILSYWWHWGLQTCNVQVNQRLDQPAVRKVI